MAVYLGSEHHLHTFLQSLNGFLVARSHKSQIGQRLQSINVFRVDFQSFLKAFLTLLLCLGFITSIS